MSKIKVENLKKVFNAHSRNSNRVLKGVSFELPDKGLVAIFGKSGSGKTTLLNIIGGLDKQDGGKVYVDGECTTGKADRIRNAKIGFIFQNYYLEKGYSIAEIMRNQMIIAGFKDEEEIKRRTEAVLKLVDMERYKNKQGDALSGGQQQRVAIARALIKGSDIILADEPTGNLDAENTTKVMDILKEISKTQLVVIVTHEVSLIEKYADSHIKIVDGEISETAEVTEAVEYVADSNEIEVDEKTAFRQTNGDFTVEYFGEPTSGDVQIITDKGNVYIRAGKNVTVLDSGSEKKIVFKGAETADGAKKTDSSLIEKFTKSGAAKNGRLFNFKRIMKSIGVGGEEKLYSTANIFKQIFILAMAIVTCFFSFSVFEAISATAENKALGEHTAYVKLGSGTYEMLKNADSSAYSEIDFFETQMREGTFSFNNVASLSGIKEKYSPKYINVGDEFEGLYGAMPKDNEVLVSRRLADRLIKDLREKETQSERSLLMMVFDNDYRISGIVDGEEPAIYFNKVDYVNFLGVYSQVGFADRQSFLLTSDYVNNYFSAEIALAPVGKRLETTQVAVEINRNSLYKMMTDTSQADTVVESANAKLATTPAVSLANSYPLTVKNFTVVRARMDTDIKIYVTQEVLDNIFVYICPSSLSDGYFRVRAESEELLAAALDSAAGNIPAENIENIYESQNKDRLAESASGLTLYLLVAVLLYCIYFFIEKSGSVKNSKEYGVYRAIGVNKGNLLFKEGVAAFMNNIISYFVFGVVTTVILTARYAVINVAFGGFVLLTLAFFAVSALLMIVISLLPYLFVLYKTPAQILARYDI